MNQLLTKFLYDDTLKKEDDSMDGAKELQLFDHQMLCYLGIDVGALL